MFEQVTVLLSFVYAIALTHLLSSANELVLEHRRVQFSGLYALWMANALLLLIVNWLSFWGLHTIKTWTVSQILLQFSLAIVQYFSCSLLSVRPNGVEPIDMGALFQQRRAILASAFAGIWIVSIAINYLDREVFFGPQSSDWIWANVFLMGSFVFIALSGWAKPLLLQWVGGLGVFAIGIQFLIAYTITN